MRRIIFNDKRTNATRRINGIRINRFLAVAERQIFRTDTGEPLFHCVFETNELAVRVAEWLNRKYRYVEKGHENDFFACWTDPKNWHPEFWRLAKYTVSNGLRCARLLDNLQKSERVLTTWDVEQGFKLEKEEL